MNREEYLENSFHRNDQKRIQNMIDKNEHIVDAKNAQIEKVAFIKMDKTISNPYHNEKESRKDVLYFTCLCWKK